MYKIGYRIKTTLVLFAIAAISGCVSSSHAKSSSHEWSGEWQLKDPSGWVGNVKLILTPEGKAYVLPPQAASTNSEYPETWRWEGKAYVLPPQAASNENVVYELPLERVSNQTSLPEGAKVLTLTEVMEQSEAKTYVGVMNRVQQANFIGNNQFVTNLSDLQIGIQSETDNYIYKIIPQSDEKKGIMHIAQAKQAGLKSYVGIVWVNRDNTTLAKLCETEKPLSQTPQIPDLSPENVSCPSGFTALK